MKRLGYLDGLATGLWLLAFAGGAVLAAASPGFSEMYRSINPSIISGATKVVLSPAWYIGVPLVMLAAMIGALVWRPRYAIVGVAVGSLAVAVFWLFTAYGPMFALAGNIR